MLYEAVHGGIVGGPGQDRRVSGCEGSPALKFQRPPHHSGATARLPLGYQRVDEVHDIVGKAYRDLSGHPIAVPSWDRAGVGVAPCQTRRR